MITTEMGKTLVEARSEAAKCVKGMRFYADHAEAFLGGRAGGRVDLPWARNGHMRITSRWAPVLAVMPWN